MLTSLVAALTLAGSAEPERPNILFLFVDDQAFDTVSALGHPDIQTPHLDRLVTAGTTFTHAYNMGAWHGAVCVASRTMLVTGQSLFRAQASEGTLNQTYVDAERLWPQRMAAAGYSTWFSGKWHVKADVQRAFQTVRNKRPGMPNQTPTGYDRPHPGQPDPWSPFNTEFNGYWKGGTHWSEVLAQDAVDFLAEAEVGDQPWFMYLAFNAPHDPRQAPESYLQMYPPDELSLPRPVLDLYPHRAAMQADKDLRDERLAPFPRTDVALRVHRAEYYAIISHLDAQVGRILDAVDELPADERPWIFFTADHGLACGHHGLLGKQNQYDHSVRVPFIVTGPGVPAGRRIDAPIHLQDVMPTTLELAGADVPDDIDFTSRLAALRGDAEPKGLDVIFGSYRASQRMVQVGSHKLILYPATATKRLFDLTADPDEARDLSSEPDQLERMRTLFAALTVRQAELGDSLDLTETYPELATPSR